MDNRIISKAAKQYETPFYLYDKEIILKQIEKLKNTLPMNAFLYYSMKANPLLGICQIMRKELDGVEVSSNGELYSALKAGFLPDKIIFSGPGKTMDELAFAVDSNIKLINVESLRELEIINEISKARNKVTPIAIRINPSVSYSKSKIIMTGGVSSQFGIEEEQLNDTFFHFMKKYQNIMLVGIQVYTGTQNLAFESLAIHAQYCINLALELSQRYDFPLKYLNLGGGFGVPYFQKENELDIDKLKIRLSTIFSKNEKQLETTEIIFESGRYLMAESGVFVTKVLYIKESKGNYFLICDGGSNFHSSSAFLGRVVRNNFPIYVLNKEKKDQVYTVTGPLCTPTDIIGQDVKLDSGIEIGDVLIIEKSGAYGLTYSPADFLSHSNPLELIYDEYELYILREKISQECKLKYQRSLA